VRYEVQSQFCLARVAALESLEQVAKRGASPSSETASVSISITSPCRLARAIQSS